MNKSPEQINDENTESAQETFNNVTLIPDNNVY